MVKWDEDGDDKVKKTGEPGEYCEKCGANGYWLHLIKCPMCHKYVCDDCRYSVQGKDFCSRFCANEFFWGDEDE